VRTSRTKKLSKAKADKKFSEYIRRRDADKDGYIKCCTCPTKKHWKEMDCGHFISRRYEATRHNDKNAGPQCPHCNRFNQGKQFEFAKYVDKRWGEGTADELLLLSKWICKRNQYDYEMIAQEYDEKIKKLENENQHQKHPSS
jgi:hypothetical protein